MGGWSPLRGAPGDGASAITMDDLKHLLAEHSMGVMSEVQRMLPPAPAAYAGALPPAAAALDSGWATLPASEGIDMAALTQALVDRDREVQRLEERLSGLQTELRTRDDRVSQLTEELDQTVREVRHRQLDLEFHQLKLEERVRANAELEQLQGVLSSRVEEASLSARHAALDMNMPPMTPRSLRAQGSLPWALRKGRSPPGCVGAIEGGFVVPGQY